MQCTMFRRSLALAVVTAGAAGVAPAQATDVTAYAPDGRVLVVGSVVTEGTRSGDVCTFVDGVVTVVAPLSADGGAVSLGVDETCRLVVTHLGALADAALANESLGRRPKLDDPSQPSPAGVGDVGEPGLSIVRALGDGLGFATEAAADAASTEVRQVKVRQLVVDPAGVRHYEDLVSAQYTRNLRKGTVGSLAKTAGYCEGPALDSMLPPPGEATELCYFRRTANGPTKVRFVSGGYYRTTAGPVVVDERRMKETFEATFTNVRLTCDPGGVLLYGWDVRCDWNPV